MRWSKASGSSSESNWAVPLGPHMSLRHGRIPFLAITAWAWALMPVRRLDSL